MIRNFIDEFNDYCQDHYKHFKFLPKDFEYQNKIYVVKKYKYLLDNKFRENENNA
jgi:hypothetical protein|tara:strand:+ start:132 stop:296 length:165 start_codon:yes stop_codon:yes gene_type:complete